MTNDKKGFVLYFDSCEQVQSLEAAQRGELLLALYRYANAVSKDVKLDPLKFVLTCDALESDTRMAFCFLASIIRRDTVKWMEHREHYRAASAQRRCAAETPQKESAPDRRTATMAKYIKQ